MRIIAGTRRGKILSAPTGQTTRPTADRVRQALFDAILHAPWGGRDTIEGASVLDGFAGTGALGLEAVSRGAERCVFFEQHRAALAALRANIAACAMGDRTRVIAGDVLSPPKTSTPCGLVFLDPPYNKGLPALALAALGRRGWITPGALIVVETGKDEPPPLTGADILFERAHGAARLWGWRQADMPSFDTRAGEHG